jgi:hypothetical protein
MTPDLDRIIAGLSEYERRAMSGRIVHISKRDGLVAKGLIANQGCPDWTQTGLAVRKRLQEMNDG